MKTENRSVVVDVKLGENADKNMKHDEILEGDELFCVLIWALVMQVNLKFVGIHLTVHLGCMPV